MIAPPENSVMLEGRLREVTAIVLEFESHPDVMNVSVFNVHVWLAFARKRLQRRCRGQRLSAIGRRNRGANRGLNSGGCASDLAAS